MHAQAPEAKTVKINWSWVFGLIYVLFRISIELFLILFFFHCVSDFFTAVKKRVVDTGVTSQTILDLELKIKSDLCAACWLKAHGQHHILSMYGCLINLSTWSWLCPSSDSIPAKTTRRREWADTDCQRLSACYICTDVRVYTTLWLKKGESE